MPLTDNHEARLTELIDRDLYTSEATYHAQVSLFRRWLILTDRAMQDEGVSADTIQRTLNRIVYGAPDPTDGYGRRARERELIKLVTTSHLPASFFGPGPTPANTVRPDQSTP